MVVDNPSGQKGVSAAPPQTKLAVANGQNGVAQVNGAATHEVTTKRKQKKAVARESDATRPATSRELKAEPAERQPERAKGAAITADVPQSKKRKRKENGEKPANANGIEDCCMGLPTDRALDSGAEGPAVTVMALPAVGPGLEGGGAREPAEAAGPSVPPKPPSESHATRDTFVTARVATSDRVYDGSVPAALGTFPALQQDGVDGNIVDEKRERPSIRWAETTSTSAGQAVGADGNRKPGPSVGAAPRGLESKPAQLGVSPVRESHLKNSDAGGSNRSAPECTGDVPGESKQAQLEDAEKVLEGPSGEGQLQSGKGNQRSSVQSEQAASPVRKGGRARKASRKADELLQYSPEEARGVSGLGLRRRPEDAQDEGRGLQKGALGARPELGVLDFGGQGVGLRRNGSLVELSESAAQLGGEKSGVSHLGEGDGPGASRQGLQEGKSQQDREERAANAGGDAKREKGDVSAQGQQEKGEGGSKREQAGKRRRKKKEPTERRKRPEGSGEGASEGGGDGNKGSGIATVEVNKEKGPEKAERAKHKRTEGKINSQRGDGVQSLQTEGLGASKQGDRNGLSKPGPSADSLKADSEPDLSGGLTPPGKKLKITELADICLRASQSAASPTASKKVEKPAPATPRIKRKPAPSGAGPVIKTCGNCGRTRPATKGQFFGHPFFTEQDCCSFCFHPTKPARTKAIAAGLDPDDAVRAVLLDRKARYENGETGTQKSRAKGSASDPSSPVPPFTKAPRSPRKVVKPGGPVKLAWQSRGEAAGDLPGGSPVLESAGKSKGPLPNGAHGVSAAFEGASPGVKPAKSRPKQVAEKSQGGVKVGSSVGKKRKEGPEAGSPQGKKRKLGSAVGALKLASPAKGSDTPGKAMGAKELLSSILKPGQSPQKSPLQKLLSRPPKTRPTMSKQPAKAEPLSKRPKAKERSAPQAPPADSHRLETPPVTPKVERREAHVKRPASSSPEEFLRDPYPVVQPADGDDVSTSAVASGSGESLAAALAAFREGKRAEGSFYE